MLHSELPFKSRHWAAKIAEMILSEGSLGFLAIAAAALTLIPMLFVTSTHTESVLATAQWSIVGIFGIEYGLALATAPDRVAFLRNPWRLLDLLTIILPLATLFPQISPVLRSSPVLRLLRLIRIVALGLRASGVVVREEKRRAETQAIGPVRVAVLRIERSPALQPATWKEFLQWTRSPGEEWYHVSNLSTEQIRDLASALGITPSYLESHLTGTSYPHLDSTESFASFFVSMPEPQANATSERTGLLLLVSNQMVFTLSRHPTGLMQAVANALSKIALPALPFPVRMTCTFVRAVLDRNEELVGRFESELRALEEVPVRESRPPFFEQCFRLKKELATAQSDLWRLKGILSALAESRVTLPSGGAGEAAQFRLLAESADFLYETVVNLRESVLSLIDLHLNVVSFEINRVMRVLAVVSVLGLIPAVVGGLFGMNLADNPWPFTLPQVAFGVCLGMVLCLYLFLIKGWLR
jgi:Mg2+ and Co2+ transporter CorA